MISDPTATQSRRENWSHISAYAGVGFVLGALLVLTAWIFELQRRQLAWSWVAVQDCHSLNPILLFIDVSPFISAIFFGMIGRIQAQLKITNLGLEDRVRARMVELTFEKARSSAILDNAADGIICFDEAGKIVVYNNAAERIFGYPRGEAIGRDLRLLVPSLDFDPQQRLSVVINTRGVQSTLGGSREFDAQRKDGSQLPVELDVSKFTVGDEVSFTAIIRDISERRRVQRLEKSMQQLTEALNESKDLESLYRAIHVSLSQIIEATNLCLALLVEDGRAFDVAYSVDQYGATPLGRLPAAKSLLRLVINAGRPLLIEKAEFDELVRKGEVLPTARPFVSWLGVPLVSLGNASGVIAIQSYTEGVRYTDKDVWIMNLVSAQIANAIEREQAREALRQSEKRYRRMIEEAGDIVYTTDLRGRFTYLNPPSTRLTGYQENELLGHHWEVLLDAEWRRTVAGFYLQQLNSRTRETTLEFPIQKKDGSQRWIEQRTTLVLESGRPVAFQSIVHDITERREAEAALREREERFRTLSAASPIGIFQLDARGNCIYTNKRFQEITGQTLEETLGTGWFDCVHPDERETFRTEWVLTRFEVASSATEVRVLRARGEVRWVNVRWAATFDGSETLTGYVGTVQDITDQKRSEQINQVHYEISQALQSTTDLQEFLASLQDSLDAIIDTTNFYVALYNEEKKTISFPYAREVREEKLNLPERPLGKGLTGLVLRTGRPLLLDEQGLSRVYASGEAQLIGKPTKNWLGVPLIANGKTIGAVIVQSYTDSAHYTDAHVQTMSFVSSQIAHAIQRKQADDATRRYTRELAEAHNRIKEDLRIAARIQKSRLPSRAPDVPGVEFDWFFDSFEEVAGDMFNFVPLDEHRFGVYIFDVSGHGVSAALLSMSLSRSLTAATDGSGALLRPNGNGMEVASPAQVARVMNERYPMSLDTNQYFTMIYGILDLRTLVFSYVRGGHPPPVIITNEGAREIESGCGPAIGILPSMAYEEIAVQLHPGDRVVLFTDGVDESVNNEGEQFGIPRVIEALGQIAGGGIKDNIRVLRESVKQFVGGAQQHDDITIVGFGIKEFTSRG